jgi:hypothetical protein
MKIFNLTSRNIGIFIAILFFSFFISPKLSSAAVSLSTSSLISTSVTINAAGLASQSSVILTVKNDPSNIGTPAYNLSSSGTQANFNGQASSNYFALSPEGHYVATVAYYDSPTVILASLNFTTPAFSAPITSFKFLGLNPAVNGSINTHSILLSVPFGTNITALVPTIVVSNGGTVSPASLVAKDFTNPVNYLVVAADGSRQNYTAVVTVENYIPSMLKITSITPSSGKVGSSVVINGSSLDLVDKVLFNNTEATDINFFGPEKITVSVPKNATTGKIILKTLSNTSATSAEDFTVSSSGGGGGGGGDDTDLSNSGEGLVVDCGAKGCGFDDFMDLINRVINFILFVMALPIAAIMFAYAGLLLVLSGGASEKRTKAKNVFTNVAIGLVLAAAAWLIIHTVLSIVGFDGSWIGL